MKKVFLLFVLVGFLFGGCGTNEETFTYAIKASIESLDLAKVSYNQSFQMDSDIYATLLEVNGNGELVNGLATDIKVSEDGLVYTIKLRDDAVWVDSNGEEKGSVTANDFVFSWQRMINPNTGALYQFIFEPLKNAMAVEEGTKDPTELGVKAIDQHTLEITLENPTPYFESMLAFPAFAAMPVEAEAEYGSEFATSAATMWYDGAFYVSDYAPDDEVKLLKNELYYDADNVALPGVTYKVIEDTSSRYNAFKTGELDFAEITSTTDIEDAEANGTLVSDLTGYSYYLNLNQLENHITSDENLKKALAYGFDREGIEEIAYGGYNNPIEYIIPKDFTTVGYDGKEYRDYSEDSLITYDEAKANEYFDKYMKENGMSDRSEIVLEYISEDSAQAQKLADSIQSHYKQTFGITVDIKPLPFEQYVDARNKGEYDMAVNAWGPDFADPSTYLSLWQSGGALNYPNYSNSEYDQLYKEAVNEMDVDQRFADFAELEKMIVEDNAVVPFYQLTKQKVISEEYTVPSHLFLIISNKYVTVNE